MTPFQSWSELAQIQLLRSGVGNAAYACVLNHVQIQELAAPLLGVAPIGVWLLRNGTIRMGIHYGSVKHLTREASAELFKHEALHLLCGHLSPRIGVLRKQYGDVTVQYAVDCVVNQHCGEALLAREGLPGITVEKLGLPKHLTTEEYCVRLPTVKNMPPLQERFISDEVVAETADMLIAEMLRHVSEECRDRHASIPREGELFVEQVMRKSEMPWYSYIRKLETSCLQVERIQTPCRPSRRCPQHLGRIRRGGVKVWFAVDTSGSMMEKQLSLVSAELKGLHNRGASITVLHIDDVIVKEEEFDPFKSLSSFAGRGCTDFSPVFLKLRSIPWKSRPGMIVYFTDGFGSLDEYRRILGTERLSESPESVPLIWLLPEGTSDPKVFRERVGCGDVALVVVEKW